MYKIKRICCRCRRILGYCDGGTKPGQESHGYCDPCFKIEMAEIKEIKEKDLTNQK
jgi:hypothetical protein